MAEKSVFQVRRELDEQYFRELDKQVEQEQREEQGQKLHKHLDKQSSQIQELQTRLNHKTPPPATMPPKKDEITEQRFQDHKKDLEMVNPRAWDNENRMLMYLSRQRESYKDIIRRQELREKEMSI